MRIFGVGYGTVHMASSPTFHHVYPKNYRFVSYHPSGEYGGHVVYYDEDSLRAAPQRALERADGAAPTVAFVGDSFVEALQLSHERSFVGRLEEFASGGATVRNYGTSSYSPLLYLMQ